MRLPAPTKRTAVAVLAFDALALGVWWYCIPYVKRPGDALFVLLIVLGVLTALGVKNRFAQSASLVAVALGVSLYALELAQRHFDLVGLFNRTERVAWAQSEAGDETSPYYFNVGDVDSYLRAKERALRDGVKPGEVSVDFAGDIFADVPGGELRVRQGEVGGRVQVTVSKGESPYMSVAPLGIELRPDFVWRFFATAEKDGVMLWDAVNTTNSYGVRATGGNENADDAYVFMGCSFVFGAALSDHETLPNYFSQLFGYEKYVVNTAVSGNGPHHALRDLELNYRLGRAGVDPSEVRGVYYGYISNHAMRVVATEPPGSPRYVVENGEAVYKGAFGSVGEGGRLGLLLSKTRLYPAVTGRLAHGEFQRDDDLALAILVKMHTICRERYNVPLQVVEWEAGDAFVRRMRDAGIVVHRVVDILGVDWERWRVKYLMADGHPSAHANRLIARHLYAAAQGNRER